MYSLSPCLSSDRKLMVKLIYSSANRRVVKLRWEWLQAKCSLVQVSGAFITWASWQLISALNRAHYTRHG